MVQSSSAAVNPEAPPLGIGHEQSTSELADENTMAQQQGGEPESKGDGDSETDGNLEYAQQSQVAITNRGEVESI